MIDAREMADVLRGTIHDCGGMTTCATDYFDTDPAPSTYSFTAYLPDGAAVRIAVSDKELAAYPPPADTGGTT